MSGGTGGIEGMHLVPIPTYRDHPAVTVADVVGVDLHGRPMTVRVAGQGAPTLFLFLSSHCGGCRDLWEALTAPGAFGPPRSGRWR